MKITYYLAGKEVKKAIFRTFSSQCTKWLRILEINLSEIEVMEGELGLDYNPGTNSVNLITNNERVNRILKTAEEAVQTEIKHTDLKRFRTEGMTVS